MAELSTKKRLKKELKLIDVFAIAAGTTLSAGFFLLPGIAVAQSGPALVIAYVIAAIPLIPSMFSVIELATAMPRAGGVYYFLDRTLGPQFGTIGGIGTWLALILKVAFALVGMGAYISLYFPELSITPIAIILAVLLGIINALGTKSSGKFQVFLVAGLIILVIIFVSGGIPEIDFANFNNFFGSGFENILSTAGLVYISYVGITKVASLSEEVENPEKNLPKGVIIALSATVLIYVVGISVMVGVLSPEGLSGNLTPAATTAEMVFGKVGSLFITIAALLAFTSVSNAGIMSASRYPLAMGRDHIMPRLFVRLSKTGTPLYSILITVLIIIFILLFLNPAGIAKLASAFQLLMFALVCLAVIVMRESLIESYDPGYKSPFYPWLQIFGIFSSLYLIFQMGWIPSLFSIVLIIIALLWYYYYAQNKVSRSGAIYHVFERLGHQRYDGLDSELRGILKEKGLREEDPFDEIVTRSVVIDLKESSNFESVVKDAADSISGMIPLSKDEIIKQIMDGTRVGATPVTHGVALPHFRIEGILHAYMVLVRSIEGIKIQIYNPLTQEEEDETIVNAIFFLVSPENNPAQHLRILARIAGRVDEESFTEEWINAENEHELKEALLHDERFMTLTIDKGGTSEVMIGKAIREITIPQGCLVALLRREDQSIIPKGNTVLEAGDRLTVIGDPSAMKEMNKLYKNE